LSISTIFTSLTIKLIVTDTTWTIAWASIIITNLWTIWNPVSTELTLNSSKGISIDTSSTSRTAIYWSITYFWSISSWVPTILTSCWTIWVSIRASWTVGSAILSSITNFRSILNRISTILASSQGIRVTIYAT